jgi:osmotically-inducible protein OsmY
MDLAQLGASITLQLEQVTGLRVSVGLHGRTATLRGRVPSAEARQAILGITAELAPRWRIIDDLDLDIAVPEAACHVRIRELDHPDEGASTAEAVDVHSMETDAFAAGESGEPFVPAIDPVVGLDHRGRVQVIGGFAISSLDEIDVEPSAHDPLPGDEALAEAIVRELREDASTTALEVSVEVHEGVATLRGTVAGPEDADAAESVVARVPGVLDIVDLLDVVAFNARSGRSPR